jgi:hypothetical protein
MATLKKLPASAVVFPLGVAYVVRTCEASGLWFVRRDQYRKHTYSAATAYGVRTRWKLKWGEYLRPPGHPPSKPCLKFSTRQEAESARQAEIERLIANSDGRWMRGSEVPELE